MTMEGPRGLKPSEFESLCTLNNTVFRPNGSGRMELQYPLLFAEDNFDNLLVMVDDGRVVSHVGTLTRDISILGHQLRTISIGAVATYEAYRGRGLATALMDAAIQKGKAEGSALMLISGARGLYQRLGATSAGQYVCYSVPRDALSDGHVKFTLAEDRDLPALIRIYAHEPSRYVRSTKDFQTCVQGGWICDRGGDTLAIKDNGTMLAYAGVQRARHNRPDEVKRARLTEIAGSRTAIVQALPPLFDRYDVDIVEIVTTQADLEMAQLLRPYPVEAAPQSFMGTSLVLLPDDLLHSFGDYFTNILGKDQISWTVSSQDIILHRNGQSLRVTPDTIGQLIFGVVDPDVDPRLSLSDGPLREALDVVFPLQLPWYGYNFV
jgi:predicted N-acetyltransferase YhbS